MLQLQYYITAACYYNNIAIDQTAEMARFGFFVACYVIDHAQQAYQIILSAASVVSHV